jgi:hypothetical protein
VFCKVLKYGILGKMSTLKIQDEFFEELVGKLRFEYQE